MSWVKLDDVMPEDEKIASLSDLAFRVYVSAICYSSRMLTDGRVPKNKAQQYAGRQPAKILRELAPGLLHEAGDVCESEFCKLLTCLATNEYLVHNYLKYNPTRDYVLAEREKARARMNAGRSGRRSGNVRANISRTRGEL